VWQGTRAERLDPLAWVGRWVLSIVGCEKPVIAAVNGVAAGAGFGLALAADVRLVSSAATLTAGYVRRGLSPDAGVSYFLPRQIGLARAADIILTGRDVDAAEAERIGLASRVLPAERFAEAWPRTPSGWRPARRSRWRSPSGCSREPRRAAPAQLRDELTNIKSCLTTRDVAEAKAAFHEKRAPRFTGT
jgi:2-(1,2-epoxy-1,2-dihydrophenyl)acetyl-CoA isomerase